MNELEWLESTDPEAMLRHVHPTASERKLRLFACACCRRHWELLPDEASQELVETAERYADGRATLPELWLAKDLADAPLATLEHRWLRDLVWYATVREWPADAVFASLKVRQGQFRSESRLQADLLRELFGNPFHRLPVPAAWLRWNDRTVQRLASAIYDEGRFHDLPILADALLDAGCDNETLLEHCRGDGPHYRGCWALDVLLGKQ